MKNHLLLPLLTFSLFVSCSSEGADPTPTPPTEQMYFPPVSGDAWETKSVASLGWDQNQVQPLLDYLTEKHTKSFIVLINGRIVLEEYFNGHSATTPHYWASAGKTLTATMTGIAQHENLLSLDDKVSDHLGTGWTSLTLAKENMITNRHLLTMTSGLEDIDHGDCVTPECLTYVADAGTRWGYHNVYVKLQDVIAAASGQTFNSYFNTKLRDKIGMNGTWINVDQLSVYFSNSRSMARFGLLALNKGKWNTEQIVPEDFFHAATTTSQNINLSYGYLWWINGKQSFHMPQSQIQFPGSIVSTGPADMYMALGKDDQKIYVVPSKKLVIIRMGDSADGVNAALSPFDEELWEKLNLLMN
ncbi:MAG TPA: serine hydrolase [Flavobacterium sp.]|jgi:CubicO group peptidase (beta-lactamase class C family)